MKKTIIKNSAILLVLAGILLTVLWALPSGLDAVNSGLKLQPARIAHFDWVGKLAVSLSILALGYLVLFINRKQFKYPVQ